MTGRAHGILGRALQRGTLRLVAVGSAAVLGAGAVLPAQAAGAPAVAAAVAGELTITTSGSLIPCVGNPSASFSNLPIAGVFNDSGSVTPYVGEVATGALTEQMNCVTPVVSTGTIVGGVSFSNTGIGIGTVCGTVNSGTLAVSAGLLAAALVPLSFGVNGDSCSHDSASVVAVIAAVPNPTNLNQVFVAGPVAG